MEVPISKTYFHVGSLVMLYLYTCVLVMLYYYTIAETFYLNQILGKLIYVVCTFMEQKKNKKTKIKDPNFLIPK